MIKIKFPSPSELSNEDWLEQMELTLYHIKKAYLKFKSGVEKPEEISMWFSYPEMENNKTFKELTMKEEISYDDTQDIEFVIDY